MNASWCWALRTSSPAETSDLWFLFSVTEVAAYLGWCCSCQSWSYTPGSYLHAVFGNAMTAALGSIHNRTSVYLVLQTCSAVKPNAKKVLQVYQRKTLYVSLISGPCTFSKVFSVVKNIEKSTCTLVSYSLVRALKLFARKNLYFYYLNQRTSSCMLHGDLDVIAVFYILFVGLHYFVFALNSFVRVCSRKKCSLWKFSHRTWESSGIVLYNKWNSSKRWVESESRRVPNQILFQFFCDSRLISKHNLICLLMIKFQSDQISNLFGNCTILASSLIIHENVLVLIPKALHVFYWTVIRILEAIW